MSGFAQHRAVVRQLGLPSDARAMAQVTHTAAAVGCVLVCALMAIYLAANIK